jgi:hypothetical protein
MPKDSAWDLFNSDVQDQQKYKVLNCKHYNASVSYNKEIVRVNKHLNKCRAFIRCWARFWRTSTCILVFVYGNVKKVCLFVCY